VIGERILVPASLWRNAASGLPRGALHEARLASLAAAGPPVALRWEEIWHRAWPCSAQPRRFTDGQADASSRVQYFLTIIEWQDMPGRFTRMPLIGDARGFSCHLKMLLYLGPWRLAHRARLRPILSAWLPS
jgi:hypothetical protein